MKRLLLRAGMCAFILGALLSILPPVVWGQGPGDETVSVTSLRAPLHVGPSAQTETLVMLPRGSLLLFLGQDESLNWVEVETDDGTTGWVSIAHVRLNGPYIPPESGVTWNAVDGVADDWDRFLLPYEDVIGDSTGEGDIRAVRSFINDGYLYVLIQMEGSLENVALLSVDIVTNTEGNYATYQYALTPRRAGTLVVISEDAGTARDASSVIDAWGDEAVEFRMPLELLDSPPGVNIVAVRVEEVTDGGVVATDELAVVMPAVVTTESEPVPDAMIVDERVNLRAAPANGRIMR
ncbi:MAG: hypothetical protein JW910_07590, partial [Anaerolineae bacterium]|nr:hypothetical protein [Anaerolineae bacterium]